MDKTLLSALRKAEGAVALIKDVIEKDISAEVARIARHRSSDEYVQMTYRGREIDEARNPDHMGTCSIDAHRSQLKTRNKEHWIHYRVEAWLRLAIWERLTESLDR